MQMISLCPAAFQVASLRRTVLRMLIVLALALGAIPQAQAVIFTFSEAGFPQIVLTVGQPGGGRSTASFNLNTFDKLTTNTTEQAFVTPAPNDGIEIRVRVRNNGAARVASLSTGMSVRLICFNAPACSGYPGGTFGIPPEKFSWIVTNPSSLFTPSTGTISTPANGQYSQSNGVTNRILTQFIVGSPGPLGVDMSFFLRLLYNNDTRYPAGSYSGTVTYNLSMN